MSADPLPVEMVRPHMWLQMTTARENGKEVDLPRYERHLLCDEKGHFPQDFTSTWESAVLKAELARNEAIGWYRNPARSGQDSLGLIYEDANENRILRPDFIFFVRLEDEQSVLQGAATMALEAGDWDAHHDERVGAAQDRPQRLPSAKV
ncbi:hypothetical protein C0V73_00015 [Rhizobium sp. TH135]|uniref:hypothetical protein n=1 Tax=Rhizobium sp. TH135 TaxID=2067451 RepID=UPI000C797B9A|nr:hypothetical protein [Rhizobium sp. TH135]PLK72262.1 hypothetical protein C0V73_00015 [Rhizobium sp. TH135]